MGRPASNSGQQAAQYWRPNSGWQVGAGEPTAQLGSLNWTCGDPSASGCKPPLKPSAAPAPGSPPVLELAAGAALENTKPLRSSAPETMPAGQRGWGRCCLRRPCGRSLQRLGRAELQLPALLWQLAAQRQPPVKWQTAARRQTTAEDQDSGTHKPPRLSKLPSPTRARSGSCNVC